MFRKLGFAAVVVAVGLFVLSWTGLNTYAMTFLRNAKNSVKNQVPLEFQIQCVRNDIDQLIPDMKKNLSVIAEEMVAIENLRNEITTTKVSLKKQKENILTMTHDLESGAKFISYDGREYKASRVREKLERDFAAFQQAEASLKSKEQLLEAKEKGLDATREQLAGIRAQKQELELQVAKLEADLNNVRLAQSKSKLPQLDDSRLNRCKAALAEIRNRIEVEQKTSALAAEFANDAIPVEKKTKSLTELSREIKAHLEDHQTAADPK